MKRHYKKKLGIRRYVQAMGHKSTVASSDSIASRAARKSECMNALELYRRGDLTREGLLKVLGTKI